MLQRNSGRRRLEAGNWTHRGPAACSHAAVRTIRAMAKEERLQQGNEQSQHNIRWCFHDSSLRLVNNVWRFQEGNPPI
jgi:hypothetical protein